MIKDNYGDPKFEVRNYLYREDVQNLTEKDIFQDLTQLITKEIKGMRSQFMSDEVELKDKMPMMVAGDVKTTYLLPVNITNNAEVFTQTGLALNSPNMCLFDVEIGLWTGKIRVNILSLPVGSKLTFGLIHK